MGMTGYKSVRLARKESNRGSVIWVRSNLMDRMVRVYAPKKKDTGAEIIQLQMDTITAYKHLRSIPRNWKISRGKRVCPQKTSTKSDRMQKCRSECNIDG